MKETAVIYHSAPAYRLPIFRRLFGVGGETGMTLFAGETSNQPTIRLIDPTLAEAGAEIDRLRWIRLRNWWAGEFLFQPGVLLLPFQRRWGTLIFLGNAHYVSTWIAAALGRLTGKRILFWTHGFRGRSDQNPKRSGLKSTFFRLAHGWIVYGSEGKRILTDLGFPENRIYIGYNSLDYDRHLALRKQFQVQAPETPFEPFPLEAPTLVWMGRMTPEKELQVLFAAVGILKTNHFPVNLLLVGTGPEEANLKKLAQTHGIESQVRFTGPVWEEEKLGALLWSADLAVSPGPVGLFAIHAMSFGLPVITSNQWDHQGPEVEAIQEGKTGGFFDAGNADSLASEIRRWLSDPIALRRAGGDCWSMVDRFYTPSLQEKVIFQAIEGKDA